jgi:hypothetical protein
MKRTSPQLAGLHAGRKLLDSTSKDPAMIQRSLPDGTYASYNEPNDDMPPPPHTDHDELNRLPEAVVAEMLTARLGYVVTPEQVRADRVERGVALDPSPEEILTYMRKTHPDAELLKPCDHFETSTQPGDCEDCVCADCGAWVGSAEIRRCGGLCEKCLDEGEEN